MSEAEVVDLNVDLEDSLEMYSVRRRKETPEAPEVVVRVAFPSAAAERRRRRSEGCTGGGGSMGRSAKGSNYMSARVS